MGRIAHRVALGALLMLGAWLAVASALGRVAEAAGPAWAGRPGLAILSSAARVAAGNRALAAGEVATAEGDALAALRLSPLDDRALELLVRVRDVQRRWAEETRLLALSARLTRRNLPLRLTMMSAAAPLGRFAEAVRDADLLLRQGAYEDRLFTYLGQATAFPEARAAIVRRLAAQPRWRTAFMNLRGLEPDGHADHLLVLTALNRTAAPPTHTEIAPFARRVIRDGETNLAQALRTLSAPDAGHGWVLDERFARADDSETVGGLFGWTSTTGAVAAGEGDGLAIGSVGSGVLAEQVVFLPRGRYRLTWRARNLAADALPDLQWTLTCIGKGPAPVLDPPHAARSGDGVTVEQGLTVPGAGSGCSAQRLALNYLSGGGRLGSARILAVSIGAAPAARTLS